MRSPVRLGLDFSDTPPGSGAIKAVGRDFVVRYAARDWRGLKRYELDDYRANGIDVAIVYESTTGRVQEGYTAGVFDATYAHNFLVEMGMPLTMPIYFAVDYDILEDGYGNLLGYIQGCDDAIGAGRVGLYGGWNAIELAYSTGMRWLWQTSAWSDKVGNDGIAELHNGSILYQYAYNKYVAGVNCDWTDAYQENFGQESKFLGLEEPPIVIPGPKFPKPELPDFYDRVNGQKHPSAFTYKGRRYYPVRQRIRAIERTRVLVSPSNTAKEAAEPIEANQLIEIDWITADRAGHIYPLNGDGYYRGSRFEPQLFPPKSRNGNVHALHTEG